MKKTGFFVIALMVLAGFMFLGNTATTQADEGNHTIYIGVEPGNKFNVTEIKVEKGVNYTIVFVNDDDGTGHNLRIDTNQDIEDTGDVSDPNDIVIGEANGADEGVGTTAGKTWTGSWMTPNEDTDVVFYCGYAGHYSQGMEGVFIVGEGASGFLPGFGFFFAISALFITATALPVLRKRN